jgi:hypothetical protein
MDHICNPQPRPAGPPAPPAYRLASNNSYISTEQEQEQEEEQEQKKEQEKEQEQEQESRSRSRSITWVL